MSVCSHAEMTDEIIKCTLPKFLALEMTCDEDTKNVKRKIDMLKEWAKYWQIKHDLGNLSTTQFCRKKNILK